MYEQILKARAHRHTPLPDGPWLMTQKWEDVFFMHMPVSRHEIHRHIPNHLQLDTYNGEAWISITPLKISDLRMRWLPPFLYIRKFLEVNVRTYVRKNGIPGVYFFSLDAEKLLPVLGARAASLPYCYARMNLKKRGGWLHYSSRRYGKKNRIFKGSIRPVSESWYPAAGSLSHWLLERYYLYTQVKDTVFTIGIHHEPWKVADADAIINHQSLTDFLYSREVGSPVQLHYARSLRVLIWPIKKLN